MSRWTHSICMKCWRKRNPDKEPYQIPNAIVDDCCFCGCETKEGIFIRHSPSQLRCQGEHT